MKTLRIIAALGTAFACIGQGAATAEAAPPDARGMSSEGREGMDRKPLAERLRAICPANYRVEFRFGETSLFVDLNLLSVDTVRRIHEFTRGTCPSSPLRGFRLVIGYQDLPEVARMMEQRGLPPHLVISDAGKAPPPSDAMPSAPETRRYLPDGFVEDITAKTRGPSYAAGRQYRLQHGPLPDGTEPPQIVVGCGGEPGNPPGRSCTVIYRYGADLVIDYRFRLDKGQGPLQRWPTADGKIAEPDGLLAFDSWVRSFIEELRRRG